MDKKVKRDIISLLLETQSLLKNPSQNATRIREMSEHNNHNSTIFQDKDAISTAVVVYALSKIIQSRADANYMLLRKEIGSAIRHLKKEHFTQFRQIIKRMFSYISSVDKKTGKYVEDVFIHAKVKRGCRICEHGISSAQTAKLLKVTQWELLQSLGSTKIGDESLSGVDVRSRLEYVRSLFS